ncbi:penicillin-binding protein activator [Pontixanthobacter aestiaquae]|uniref:ABC transporter substrate-binding protein n=1 Tax=Pontixanthobacter aestiaquae TaxID=1509367 RepID=A0A844Z7S5_9SPHN|nr:penicillin-binding protein activator [Pontixanthobacter aestiaquae]MDN3645436.1 penicillin-binding protein activator [Pontixanthobacter aestiaquae]MXO83564.1 ABC transporter substrate-binding protein [Pontixanthobacter aestiaquae]
MNRIKLNRFAIDRRKLVVIFATAVLAGCQLVPKAPSTTAPAPTTGPTPAPTVTGLPTDDTRHRIALLVPLSGDNGAVGNSIANATTMALLDTNASNLRITTYDTAKGAREAARKAVADGNKLILGPLTANNVPQVLAEARPADIPLISYSNDTTVAGPDVFVMGHIPSQSISRTVGYARQNGARNFAAIIPNGEYGKRAEESLSAAIRAGGGSLVATESFARGNTSIVSAAQRLRQRGGFDTVLIADGARLVALAAGELRPSANSATRILGTELLSGESSITRASALQGTWFSAVSDSRFKRFADSYKGRFGGQPYRISTLGYDSVLLTLRVAQDWRVGRTFPISRLRNEDGFLGLDGVFRFQRSGLIERAMEVREVRDGKVIIVSPAPSKF